MSLEVDQSGRIENTKTSSVFAIAGEGTNCIYVSKKTKRELIKALRKKNEPKTFYLDSFCCCIYLLIKRFLSKNCTIAIDREYMGQDKAIKRVIEKLAKKDAIMVKAEIRFSQIGKKSPAHLLAIANFRKKTPQALDVSANVIISHVRKLKIAGHLVHP